MKFYVLFIAVYLCSCSSFKYLPGRNPGSFVLEIQKDGLLDCFEPGLQSSEMPVYFEGSAVAFDGKRIYIASDKDIPGKSPVLSLYRDSLSSGLRALTYLDNPEIIGSKKIEDMACYEGRILFITTAFDRINLKDNSWDNYNSIIYYNVKSKEADIITPDTLHNATTSVYLRQQISDALQPLYPGGPPYFKIEGIAALPGRTLLLGVREIGASYKDFQYHAGILRVTFREEPNGKIYLNNDMKLVYHFNPSAHSKLKTPLGLSGLTYDPSQKCIYLLTSYEKEPTSSGIGAYIWQLPISYFDNKSENAPVVGIHLQEEPLFLPHKAEGICMLNKHTLFIICDDDRIVEGWFDETPRLSHQAKYYIVKVNP
ncbi:MAG: hypothetical protein SF053_00565 [Bacteroidia bacterium]|nr:hypothetical protein [Bacteroidia bacterium]